MVNPVIIIYCPDCRGKFNVETDEFIEDEILECSLCGAELEIMQEKPPKLRLVQEAEETF